MALVSCLRFVALVALSALAVAGCGGRSQTLPSAAFSTAKESGIVTANLDGSGSGSDWPTFAHDYSRSGLGVNPSFNKSNVSKLTLSWKENLGGSVFASLAEYGGNLIVVTQGGGVKPGYSTAYDLNTSNGTTLWQYNMGAHSQGEMPPTIDPQAGLVIVAVQFSNGSQKTSEVYALRLLDGSVAWQQQLVGLVRSAPVVTGGEVYVGRAGGDPPYCLQGGISALNESTGAVDWSWNVDDTPGEGGSVWGAIAYDGNNLIFGTGNTCQEPVTTANGAVALSTAGQVVWSTVAVKDSSYDSDTGSGVMLNGGLAHFINKNGEFYALNGQSGALEWSTDLNPKANDIHANGGFTTSATDGSTIVEGSGSYKNGGVVGQEFCMLGAVKPSETTKGYHSELQGMSMSGSVKWSLSMVNRIVGDVAVANGVGFVGLNKAFVGLNLKNGKTLWSYGTPEYIDASMIVIPSGVYGADTAGNVYAFAMPSSKK